MTVSRLKELQARYGEAVDREIRSYLVRGGEHPLYAMIGYQLGYVDANLQEIDASSGKRFRPLLCLLACEAADGSWRAALPLAASIELLHNFSLVHDDIEDRDPERRHQPTVWKVWGEPQAINVGDAMFALAGLVMTGASSDAATALRLTRALHDVALSLTEGQHMDMSFESRQQVSIEEYREMIARKSAALIAFSLWSGALAADADEDTCALMRRFGAELGTAFQIHDDIMGLWGAPEVTGKQAAKDLQNRKKTLPYLFALQDADARGRKVLLRFMSGETDDIEAVMTVLASTEARSRARREVVAHLKNAMAALQRARIREGPRNDLQSLAYEITGQA